MGLPFSTASLIEQIRSDETSGSTALTVRAAEVLSSVANDHEAPTTKQFLEDLADVSRALIRAQPWMAGILNLANKALTVVSQQESVSTMREALRSCCVEFVSGLERSSKAIATRASSLIKNSRTVLTHSYSSAVERALIGAAMTNKELNVVCTESRPMFEGMTLAKNLRDAEIRAAIIPDRQVRTFIRECQTVLVGADSISPRGVVNKSGTSGIARLAHARKIPFYVLAGEEKFLPSLDTDVLSRSPSFDLTPLELVTGVVMEEAVLSPEELNDRLVRIQVHERLK